MQPTLTGFAKALTKRSDVRVQLDTGTPRTDGKDIYYRPPITLGDVLEAQRSLCERRDKVSSLLLCPACARRESILVVIYHEIAHIAFDLFAPPSKDQRREVIARAVREAGGKRATSIAARIEAAPYWSKDNYLGLARLVSEYLPFIVNCLEDARVNREMFRARPGTKAMFEGLAYDALGNGVEQHDGSVMQWNEYPLNAQASIGVFCLAAGYTDMVDLLHPDVARDLRDRRLNELDRQARPGAFGVSGVRAQLPGARTPAGPRLLPQRAGRGR